MQWLSPGLGRIRCGSVVVDVEELFDELSGVFGEFEGEGEVEFFTVAPGEGKEERRGSFIAQRNYRRFLKGVGVNEKAARQRTHSKTCGIRSVMGQLRCARFWSGCAVAPLLGGNEVWFGGSPERGFLFRGGNYRRFLKEVGVDEKRRGSARTPKPAEFGA